MSFFPCTGAAGDQSIQDELKRLRRRIKTLEADNKQLRSWAKVQDEIPTPATVTPTASQREGARAFANMQPQGKPPARALRRSLSAGAPSTRSSTPPTRVCVVCMTRYKVDGQCRWPDQGIQKGWITKA